MAPRREANRRSLIAVLPLRQQMLADTVVPSADGRASVPGSDSSSSVTRHATRNSPPRSHDQQGDVEPDLEHITSSGPASPSSAHDTPPRRCFTPSERANWHARIDELVEDTLRNMAIDSLLTELREFKRVAEQDPTMFAGTLRILQAKISALEKQRDQI